MEQGYNCEFIVEGMHCAACELVIEKKFAKVEGIKKVDAQLVNERVLLEVAGNFDKSVLRETLNSLIQAEGYRLVESKSKTRAVVWKDLILGLTIATCVFGLFILIQKMGIVNVASSDGKITFPFIFFIGVVASLSTCMAVVGGLVLSLSSNYAKGQQTKPIFLFHLSRIIGFFILGGLIGLLGSAFILTPMVSFLLNVVLFIVMSIMAINLLDIFPFLKKFQIKMPKYFGRSILRMSENNNALTPVFLGAITFLLPCGFTQSMQVYSLTTGSFLNGALTMFIFALGTFPVLALISIASTQLSKSLQSGLFFKTAAFVIIFFALFNLYGALVAVGLIPPIFNI